MDEPKRMGRPRVYHEPRRHFTITLPDALIETIDAIAWRNREHKSAYIENILRQWPEIAAELTATQENGEKS